jgi:hypothetical protein
VTLNLQDDDLTALAERSESARMYLEMENGRDRLRNRTLSRRRGRRQGTLVRSARAVSPPSDTPVVQPLSTSMADNLSLTGLPVYDRLR